MVQSGLKARLPVSQAHAGTIFCLALPLSPSSNFTHSSGLFLPFEPSSWTSPKVKHCARHAENSEKGHVEVRAPSQPCSVSYCPRGGCRLELGDVRCIIVYNGKTTGCPLVGDRINDLCDFCTMERSAAIAKNKAAPYRTISLRYC